MGMTRSNVTIMKHTLLPISAIAIVCCAGCASSAQLNKIQIGMTKDEVISILGQPDSMSAQGNVEYLTYYLVADAGYGRDQPYMVRLVDGKVESFGRYSQLLDLEYRPPAGQTAPGMPAAAPAAPAPTSDIATQLLTLQRLKDQGVLTEAEFEQAKQKLLSSP